MKTMYFNITDEGAQGLFNFTIAAHDWQGFLKTFHTAGQNQFDGEILDVGLLESDFDRSLMGYDNHYFIVRVQQEGEEPEYRHMRIQRATLYGQDQEEKETFPNGFDNWHETHFEVCTAIGDIVGRTIEEQGTGGLYELAKALTDEFEAMNTGREWYGDYFDEIEDFLDKKL